MAVLGFHIVVSLIVLTIISKLGNRLSIIQLFITNGLYRFVAPTNNELRALLPASKERCNPRIRRKKREEEDNDGFNIPKSLPVQLRIVSISDDELRNLPMYSSVHWLSLFVPLCILVYALSEVYLFVFPSSDDTNVSLLWLLIAIGFLLQVLARLTSWLLVNEDERSVVITFAAIFFLLSFIFVTASDSFFDIHLLEAYDMFSENVEALMLETGATESISTKPKNPLFLYISMSVFFSFLSAMLVFPNFRYANMYSNAQAVATLPIKAFLHLAFLMPVFCLCLFSKPVGQHLVYGPRKLLTKEQLDILRVYFVMFALLLRIAVRKYHLQAHLNTAYIKLKELQRETGHIKNIYLQSMVFRYYSYFCAVVVQYFAPMLLTLFFGLLLKTTGGLSWLGNPVESTTNSPATVGAIRSIFDNTVCRAIWSFALVITLFINIALSLIGVMYNSYFVHS